MQTYARLRYWIDRVKHEQIPYADKQEGYPRFIGSELMQRKRSYG